MLTRRDTLLGLALTSGALAFGLPRFAFARIPTERRFVFIVLRGAMDGLAAVPPYGDPDYRAVRGPLALPAPGQANGILPIDRFYGLNPALQPVAPLFQRGEALALHAVATPYRERSHFDGQDVLENGTATPHATEDGWLNRALGLYGAEGRRIGLAVGQDVPLVLRGKTPVQSWAPSPLAGLPHEFIAKLAALYKGDRLFEGALEEGAQAETLAEDVLGSGNRMGPQGPQAGAFAKLAPEAGKLLAAKDGPRVAVMECLGWDTHQAQGTVQGRLADTLKAFAEGVAGLVASLGPAWRDTVVLAASEFGRTAHANGTGGTDHGTATAAFLFGGAVRGGRVAARWPGLSQGRLYQGRDLVPTTDLRAALKAVLRDHLELPGDALDRVVLPNSTQVKPLDGLVRT
ncbi:MAG TPA: DUF1501 domain-containing protein [Alphaproteobacteria bacterium]|nr:DUF1501 domain-containing protein [Alphaproteobacteria bacterium]